MKFRSLHLIAFSVLLGLLKASNSDSWNDFNQMQEKDKRLEADARRSHEIRVNAEKKKEDMKRFGAQLSPDHDRITEELRKNRQYLLARTRHGGSDMDENLTKRGRNEGNRNLDKPSMRLEHKHPQAVAIFDSSQRQQAMQIGLISLLVINVIVLIVAWKYSSKKST